MSIPSQEIPNSAATEQRAGPKETTPAKNVTARRFVKEAIPSIEIPNSRTAVQRPGLKETNPAKILFARRLVKKAISSTKIPNSWAALQRPGLKETTPAENVTARRIIKEATSAEKIKDLSNNLQTSESRSNQKKNTSNKPECRTRERQKGTLKMSLRVRKNNPVDNLENNTDDLITRLKRQKRPKGRSRKISAVGGPRRNLFNVQEKNPSDGSSKVVRNKNVKSIDKLSSTSKKLSSAKVSLKSKNGILIFYGQYITLSSLTKLSIFVNILRI